MVRGIQPTWWGLIVLSDRSEAGGCFGRAGRAVASLPARLGSACHGGARACSPGPGLANGLAQQFVTREVITAIGRLPHPPTSRDRERAQAEPEPPARPRWRRAGRLTHSDAGSTGGV